MFERGVQEETKSNLALLSQECFLKQFYLAGGTGAALYLGHRISIDLDFFSVESFERREIVNLLKKLGDLYLEQESADTLIGNFNHVRVSFFKYSYPLIAPKKAFLGVDVAGLEDIAAMKIDAISGRGRKRDFVDLYFICRDAFGMEESLAFFKQKYKDINYNIVHILKSLTFFDDAEEDAMPSMLIPVEWDEIKTFFQKEVPKIRRF